MILKALNDYYRRMLGDGVENLASEGFQRQAIPFVVVLGHKGGFLSLSDTRTGEGKARVSKICTVPKAVKKANGIAANLLWDAPSYVLGRPKPDPRKNPAEFAARALKQKLCFISLIRERLAPVLEDAGVDAVLRFLEAGDFEAVFEHPSWSEIEQNGLNLGFQLESDNCLVCERTAVVAALTSMTQGGSSDEQICLLTGEQDEPARLNTAIKGVYGAQTAGANIVSFNLRAFNSYGKEQGFNAPVGKRAEFGYTTALNKMLQRNSRQKLMVGKDTAIFWAEREHKIEGAFVDLFGEPAKGEPEQDYKAILATFRAPMTGASPQLDPETYFYILGLSPNSARIAVRFWYSGVVREVTDNIWRHFDDLEMVKGAKESLRVTLRGILRGIAVLGKDDNVPPSYAGDIMKAILTGTPYPMSLLAAAVRRCRAERAVTYPRAALIKALLMRDSRLGTRYCNKHEREVGMSLDTENTNIGYRLGRLLAVLEKVQQEAMPGINATIRDRFYGSASATPGVVYPHLMKLKNHHLSKLENRGRAVNLEKIIGEIIDGVNEFPSNLSLADQGRFAVGYYHQRQAFFVK